MSKIWHPFYLYWLLKVMFLYCSISSQFICFNLILYVSCLENIPLAFAKPLCIYKVGQFLLMVSSLYEAYPLSLFSPLFYMHAVACIGCIIFFLISRSFNIRVRNIRGMTYLRNKESFF